jgi:hypothetical protein
MGPRSTQGTIYAALKAPLFHGSRCFRSARQQSTEAIVQPNQGFSATSEVDALTRIFFKLHLYRTTWPS